MNLHKKYQEYRDENGSIPFDDEGDSAFCRSYFGTTIPEFCRKIVKELVEIEMKLQEIEDRE